MQSSLQNSKDFKKTTATVDQCVTNIRIYSNIQIFHDKNIHLKKYLLYFLAANLFGPLFVESFDLFLMPNMQINLNIQIFPDEYIHW